MEINEKNITDIVKKCGLNPNKSLGQNFLINNNVSFAIANFLTCHQNSNVLEIGPGLGSLTNHLTKYPLDSVDVDKRMIDFLKIVYQDKKDLCFICDDILNTNVEKYDAIIGNLPYYITTDIITYLLLNAKKANEMVFMIQKEAFPRFSKKVNEDGYSPIGILIDLLGEVKKCLDVKASNFYPNPHVDSIVFKITLDNNKKIEKNYNIYKFAKTMFLNKRKTILNNLGNYLKNKSKAEIILKDLNLSFNLRPENLSTNDYINLYEAINK